MHIYLLNNKTNTNLWLIDVLNTADFNNNTDYKNNYEVSCMLQINPDSVIYEQCLKHIIPITYEGSIMSVFNYLSNLINIKYLSSYGQCVSFE